jgi:very-short-patch-repair endonuclease
MLGLSSPSPSWGGTKGGGSMSVAKARSLRKSMSPAEASLWNALRTLKPVGHHFRRQVPLGPYFADFCCHKSKLVVEVDGDSHFVGDGPRKDAIRDRYIQGEGYRVLRVTNADVLRNLPGVIEAILLALDEPPPSIPPHKGEGGGSA